MPWTVGTREGEGNPHERHSQKSGALFAPLFLNRNPCMDQNLFEGVQKFFVRARPLLNVLHPPHVLRLMAQEEEALSDTKALAIAI